MHKRRKIVFLWFMCLLWLLISSYWRSLRDSIFPSQKVIDIVDIPWSVRCFFGCKQIRPREKFYCYAFDFVVNRIGIGILKLKAFYMVEDFNGYGWVAKCEDIEVGIVKKVFLGHIEKRHPKVCHCPD